MVTEPQVTRYVAGFMFDEMNGSYVALVRKNRPEWMAGKLNAIGGHIEANELPINAMVREFLEETGMGTTHEQWQHFATLSGHNHEIFFYLTHGEIDALETKTDEQIVVRNVKSLNVLNCIPNILWLLPMAKHCLEYNGQSYKIQGAH